MQKRNLTYGMALVGLITVVACAAEAMDDMAAAAPGADDRRLLAHQGRI